jgi:hypothetical protein
MSKRPRYHEFVDEAAIDFTPLYHDRGNDVGHCVFPDNHSNGDTSGKFAIHREKKVYNCWVCDGGDLLSLVMELYDWDTETATDWLSQFAYHDTRSDSEFTQYLLEMLEDVEERVEKMPYFNLRVLDRFTGPTDYFLGRGISQEVIDEYRLCYGEEVLKPAPRKHVNGEVVKLDEDYTGPAAIFPHYWQGKLVGWQHRWMDWDVEHAEIPLVPKWLPKYTNTSDFPKAYTLYNYDYCLHSDEPVIICESVPTVLFLRSYDVAAAAYFGSQPTDAQLRLMRRFKHGVILAPDNDPTGDALLGTATPYLERFIPVFHADKVDMGPKADLGDYAKTDEPELNLLVHLQEKVHRYEVTL